MPDMSLIREKLEQIEESLNRIARRSSSIKSPDDLPADSSGVVPMLFIGMKTEGGSSQILNLKFQISFAHSHFSHLPALECRCRGPAHRSAVYPPYAGP
jgi:hypothetical protein